MPKNTLWRIPCAFFLVAAILNLCGCIWHQPLAATVKPALLPLISLTALAYVAGGAFDRRTIALMVMAQLLGCTGDVFLIGDGFPLFASGMAAFLAGHVFYLIIFGGRSWKGLTLKQWIFAGIGIVVLVAALIIAIGIKGVLLGPMAVYGTGLMLLIFSGLAGVIRIGGKTWWIIFVGALLFTFSDSLIAMGTFGLANFALRGFLIMLTYLIAQVMLATGAVRLSLGKY